MKVTGENICGEKRAVVKFKRLREGAIIPTKAHVTDAGMDIYGVEWGREGDCIVVFTGLAMSCSPGYATLLFPRSSIAKTPLRLTNSVGIIDSDYRGEIMLKFKTDQVGERYRPNLEKAIGQLVVIELPSLDVIEVEELDETERGNGGFGSSDK